MKIYEKIIILGQALRSLTLAAGMAVQYSGILKKTKNIKILKKKKSEAGEF